MPPVQCHGKALPVDPFTAEDPEIRFNDWLPTLERAAVWNGWLEEGTLMQLAGFLRNRALQEWNLLTWEDCSTLKAAVETLHTKLDSGNQPLSALDFHHAVQKASKVVADYIWHLEHTFQISFGWDNDYYVYGNTKCTVIWPATEWSCIWVEQSPCNVWSRNYEELCIAAKNEEKKMAELKKQQQFERSRQIVPAKYSTRSSSLESSLNTNKLVNPASNHQDASYICNIPTHLARDWGHRGLRVKGEQEFWRKLTMYIAVVNLRIVHQGRVTSKKLLESIAVPASL